MIDYSRHTPYSDPGPFAGLLSELPTDPAGLSAVARNLIVHYRASGHALPDSTRHEINARWLSEILTADQAQHPWPLGAEREVTDRVQGCCRDHTLFCVGALRAHGVPARSRVGYAGYFVDGWNHDHVVVDAWLDGGWVRFDPEIDGPLPARFMTAAEAWLGHRRGELDVTTFGVDPSLPLFAGQRFAYDEVIYELAHRYGDELLLWDSWGGIGPPDRPPTDQQAAWMDGLAELLVAADAGGVAAEAKLFGLYGSDARLHPGDSVTQHSPFGEPSVQVTLRR